MQKKFCPKCKTNKELSNFSKKRNGLSGYCRDCNKEYQKKHYQNNKSKYAENSRVTKAARRDRFITYKAMLKCSSCGENHPACLDFHHNDPSTKEVTISSAVLNWGAERLMSEIGKCTVLCSNCHRKLHAGLRT